MFSAKHCLCKDRASPNGSNPSVPKFSTSPDKGKWLVSSGRWADPGRSWGNPTGPWHRSGSATGSGVPRASPRWQGQPAKHTLCVSHPPQNRSFLQHCHPCPAGPAARRSPAAGAVCGGRCGRLFPTLPTGPASPAPPQSSPGMGWCEMGELGTPKQELIVFCSSSSLPRASGGSLPRGCGTGAGRDRQGQGQGQGRAGAGTGRALCGQGARGQPGQPRAEPPCPPSSTGPRGSPGLGFGASR